MKILLPGLKRICLLCINKKISTDDDGLRIVCRLNMRVGFFCLRPCYYLSGINILNKKIMRLVLLFLLLTNTLIAGSQSVQVYDLTCEYLPNPLGIDTESPRFRWRMKSENTLLPIKGWQIMMAKDSAALANGRQTTWGTRLRNDAIPHAVYDGPPLEPLTRYYWRVHVVDEEGRSCISPIAYFETGFLHRAAWQGNWISDANDKNAKPAPFFRKSFSIQKTIKEARAFVAAAGLYEFSINGKRVGNNRLDPAYTRFDRRILYVVHDVSSMLASGENVAGIILGNGWYNHQSTAVWNFHEAPWRNRPAFCLDIRIVYTDGSVEYISSGRDWKTTTGPIVFNSIYTGEHYDARLEMPGWNRPGYIDTAWSHAVLRAAPANLIVSQALYPVKETTYSKPQSINKINDSLYVVGFDKNMAGVVQLQIAGERGTVIRLKHGERLYESGLVDLSNLDVHYRPQDDTDPFQTDIFILSGKGTEEFQPRFNYKGFRYMEVRADRALDENNFSIKAVEMHSDVPSVSTLYSSNEMVEKIWKATNNSYLSNLFGYPTDCPQREKNGWTGDAHIAQETGLFNFDGFTIYEKWMADHRDEQQPNGVLPSIVPTGGWGYEWGNGPDWTSTIAIIPWNLYLFYGDLRPLRDNYTAIKKYVDYINSNYPDGLTSWGLGDWIPVKSQTPVEFTSTAYYYKDATILARAAGLLGNREDEIRYMLLATRIRDAFNRKYFNPKSFIYGNGYQTEMSVALHLGLVAEGDRARVAANLAARVKADGVKLDVGLLGTKSILNALSENGYAQLAYEIATRDSFPGWGWWIKNGATSLYENWPIDAKSDISMNHIMFGEVSAWFFKALGGIQPDAENPGFHHFYLRPLFAGGLNDFSVSYKSPQGTIYSSWKRTEQGIAFHAVVPGNSSATLTLDVPRGKSVFIDGIKKPVSGGVFSQRLPAGRYSIVIK